MFRKSDSINRLLQAGKKNGYWRNGAAYLFYCRHELFKKVDFLNKRFLDIGAGDGRFSLYAWANGALRIDTIEPNEEGSTASAIHRLDNIIRELNITNLRIVNRRFQDYDPVGNKYDIIFLHNSINHLDEEMCVKLHFDDEARKTYISLARQLRSLMLPGGKLIIVDCGRGNLSTKIKLKRGSPFNHTIEWHKHQYAETWADIFAEAGLELDSIGYAGVPKLLFLSYLLKNKLMAYLRWNTFILTMTAPQNE